MTVFFPGLAQRAAAIHGQDRAGRKRKVLDRADDRGGHFLWRGETTQRRTRHLLSIERTKSLSTSPGETDTTRIFGARARASDFVMLSTAAFEAQ